MKSLLHPRARALPVVLSTAILGLFYWGLFRLTIPGARGGEPDPEESRRLQEDRAVLRRFGKWERALKPTLKLRSYYPENAVYMSELAEIYGRLGRFREEAAMWEEFVDHSPTPIEGCPQIGQAYEKQDLPAAAVRAYERCLAFQPGNPDSIFYLAHALERCGDRARAEALYQNGWGLYPGYLDLGIGLARIRLHQGQPAEALRMALPIVESHPDQVDALLVLGLACRQLGRRDAALNYLSRGVRLADGYPDFHVVLAQIAEEDADLSAAIRHYQKAADLDRGNREVADRLARLRRVE